MNLQLMQNPFFLEQQWQETIDHDKLLLGKVVGRGSYGVVHKGSYQGQTVAAKVLDFGNHTIPEASMKFVKENFMHEVELWKNLDHPNITKPLGASPPTVCIVNPPLTKMIGATIYMTSNSRHKFKKSPKFENNFCVVSEYLKGGSLGSYLWGNPNKKLPFKTVIRFALDIARGLSYLHSEKIIHRDVKPENMLLDNQKTIKLADFGESVFEPSDLFFKSERGTRGYMAPEVFSRIPYGRKCDVYSFGICLWEIYCCDKAYMIDLENITLDIYKMMRPSIPVNCPRSLAHLMERCWDKDPEKRPEMKEVVVVLEEIEKSEGCKTMAKHAHGCFRLFS